MSTVVFYATDIHGSEKCWMKFINAAKFYQADVLILGGDMTGKMIVPILKMKDNTYRSWFLESERILKTPEEVQSLEKYIRNSGYYVYHADESEIQGMTNEKKEEIFKRLMIETMKRWVAIADERLKNTSTKLFVCPGNDDPFFIDPVLEESKCLVHCEGKVATVDERHELLSSGWTNPTPWNTYKECSEDELAAKIEKMAEQVTDPHNSIFNLHAPPYDSGLDLASALDGKMKVKSGGQEFIPVGSVAVRSMIEKYQPLFSLHGHVHESRGCRKIGRTLCFNPGSQYMDGMLWAYLITLDKDGIKKYYPITG